jgi:hypothetical protein
MQPSTSLRGRSLWQSIFLSAPGKDGLFRCARNDCVFRLVLAVLFVGALLSPAVGSAQTKNQPLPKKIASNITDMTPIALHPGANSVEFWGTVTYYGWNKRNIDPKKNRIEPFHQVGQIYDFKGFVGTDKYIATVTWQDPSQLVTLANNDMAADQPCWACGTIQTNEFFDGKLDGHRETFLVTATRQLITPQPGGDAPSYFDPQPTIITIFAFNGGTPLTDMDKLGDARSFSPPGFVQIDSFESNSGYCSSNLAILNELPIKPLPSAQFPKEQAINNGCD